MAVAWSAVAVPLACLPCVFSLYHHERVPARWTFLLGLSMSLVHAEDILAVGVVSHAFNHGRLELSRKTWLANESVMFFSNSSDPTLSTVYVPDDSQHADDPLHNNHGEARFVPALLYLSQAVPAKWYMLVDDDTYVFLRELKAVLSRFDSDARYFLGQPSQIPFASCASDSQEGSKASPKNSLAKCWVPLKMPEGIVRWPLTARWCLARPGHHCGVATLEGVGTWCNVVKDESMPYHYRVTGGFLPEAREALLRAGIGHAEQPSPKEVRGALLQERIAAPIPWGEAEFPLAVWPVGGLGMIVSAGVVRALRGAEWRECVEKLRCGPGDMRVAACLARFANVGLAFLEGLGSSLTRHPVTAEDVLELFAEEKSRACTAMQHVVLGYLSYGHTPLLGAELASHRII